MFSSRKISIYVFLLIATFLNIFISGYHFGTFDQAIHIPFVEKFADPTLFPNDRFIDLRFIHYSFFWIPFSYFAAIGFLNEIMFVLHVIITFLSFWALFRLSHTIFKDIKTAYLSVIVFIIPHISFGGFLLTEFSLLNRTFVLPFLLISIEMYLKKKTSMAFFILGAMYNFHALSVNFVLAILLLHYIWQTGFRKIILLFLYFLIPALPVLIWKFTGPATSDLTINWDWFNAVSKGMLYNVFYIFSTNPLIIMGTLSGICSMAMFYLAKRKLNSTKIYADTVSKFMKIIILILLLQIITTYFAPVSIIIQSQIIRVGVLAMLFGYLYFINLISIQLDSKKNIFFSSILLLSTIIFISPFFTIIIYLLGNIISNRKLRKISLITIFSVLLFIQLTVIREYNLWKPGIYIYPQKTNWYRTQIWATENTSKKTKFIIPPYIWWFYTTDWRVGAKRPVVTSLSELLEAAFSPDYYSYWKERFSDLAPGAIERFNGDYFGNIKITKKSFYSLSTNDFKKIAKKYNADYLVIEKPFQYPFEKVYENSGFVIYRL